MAFEIRAFAGDVIGDDMFGVPFEAVSKVG